MQNELSSDPAPASTPQWKSRPVFISSTFRDMQWERDYLNRHIFPRLAEELAKRHHHLEPIDLRLGVEAGEAGSEEARELLVLKVCLDEIKRSRPFLLVLLGDRYGWVPPPERIETAAREQGMKKPEAGKSVTALEIEFGILKDPQNPDQKSRSLFFFRQPLPYADMPDSVRADYSDAHSPDPQVRAGHAKLTDLKATLQRDPELAGRLHDYSVGWDAERQKVTDLEAFGDLVFEKLWAVIDAETKDWAAKPAPTWEEQERAGLAEFIEHRSRGFTGRTEVLKNLHALATSPTETPPTETPKYRNTGLLTGTPGSGKSALFAQLHRDLEKDSSLLILANAAGGTQRGSSVDSMLRRWIGEMHAFLEPVEPPKQDDIVPIEPEPQVADSGPKPNAISFRRKPKQIVGPMPKPRAYRLPANASNDDIEAAFYSLLHRVSSQRRVVVLLDALDQFEPTPRGSHLTWFKPQQWPPNARLIATAIPGTASEVLAKAAGTAELDLPPLTAVDAQAIGTHVWGRYHRTLNPAVLAVLIEKKLLDGTPACGNPLWLTLALEQLNLLDADDFIRAERDFTGSPGERLAALLLDTARRMPPDIESLYGWLLEQNEKAFGLAETRAFATAIALSRSGWRESDLLDLVPRLSSNFGGQGSGVRGQESEVRDPETGGGGQELEIKNQNSTIITHQSSSSLFDPLALATLRRSFRAHLVRRGEHEQLDFFHAQMRLAVIGRCALRERSQLAFLPALHGILVDHLASLTKDDPLRTFEIMHHLIATGDAERTANQLASAGAACVGEGIDADIAMLAERIRTAPNDAERARLVSWIASFLHGPDDRTLTVAKAIISKLSHALDANNKTKSADARKDLLRAAQQKLEAILETQAPICPDDNPLVHGWFHHAVGQNLSDEQSHQIVKKFDRQIQALKRGSAQSLLASTHEQLGDICHARGDEQGAFVNYQKSQTVARTQISEMQLPDGYDIPGNISIQTKLADVHFAKGNLTTALVIYKQVFASKLDGGADGDPKMWRLHAQVRIGEILSVQGDTEGALGNFNESLDTAEGMAAIAMTKHKSVKLTPTQKKDFYALMAAGGGKPSAELQASLHTLAAPSDSTPEDWNYQIAEIHRKIGDHFAGRGDRVAAFDAYRRSLERFERLAASNPENDEWQRDLFVSYVKLAQMAEQDSTGDAREWWVKAYAQLSGMKQRGIMLPTDEVRLEFLRQKVEEMPENQEFAPASSSAPTSPSNPTSAVLALLKAGRVQEALEALRPFIFPNEAIDMDHRAPLNARLAFVHALWLSGNVEGVLRFLSSLPEQDDPRVQALSRRVADWQQGLSRMQKLGFKKKPPLPAPPPLDDIT